MKILIVEDDKRISSPIAEDLRNQSYIVDVVENGADALIKMEQADYDLLLMDVMLPKLNGIEVCRTLRARGFTGFVLMLTARGSKSDKVVGLDSGADDYLVKPFDIDELNARIRAFERRTRGSNQAELVYGILSADLRLCKVKYRDIDVPLTATEYRLLVHFMRHPRQIFTKNQLVEKLWQDDEGDFPTDAVIKVHIKGLRQKLDAAGAPKDLVETVYGFGYRLKENAS